jgi:TonB family protein
MQRLLLQFLLLFLAASFLQAQSSSSQPDAARIVVNTISGPVHNAVLYAPNPVFPPAALQQHLGGRGIYAMDIVNGLVEDVRVVRSTGYKILDDSALETLRTWRFRPHRLIKVTIPIDFVWVTQQSRESSSQLQKAKAIAIFAPKPEYPLEARARRWGGSGVIMLDVDVETGKVIAAHISKSTGHQILDESALTAFQRWRFQPGRAAPHVKIPINYTVTGATY